MSRLSRREFLAASTAGGVLLGGPMRAVANAVGPVRITGVDACPVQVLPDKDSDFGPSG